jgi:hypothetical protein
MRNEHEMDPAEVRRLLTLLETRLGARGIDAQIHIIGGSAMALLFPDDPETRFTQDIDAAVQPSAPVKRVVEQIAEELGLSPTWFNTSGSPFVPPRASTGARQPGVSVTVASVEELIAMKLAASRHQDLFDLGILARHAGITDPERLVQIAYDAYGEDSMALTDSREDYLIMAREALENARRRR